MGISIWQSMEQKGYSRRDFMKFCTAAAAAAGLGQSGVAQVASAFEKKEKPAVMWMHFQECTCCSESFIRASHPIVVDALLDVLSLNYTRDADGGVGLPGGEEPEATRSKNNKGKYIVLVEGAVPTNDGGVYCMIGGKTAESILQDGGCGCGGGGGVGQLRVEWLRAGGQAEPDGRDADSQADQ